MHVGKIPASVSSAALLPLISLNRSRVSIHRHEEGLAHKARGVYYARPGDYSPDGCQLNTETWPAFHARSTVNNFAVLFSPASPPPRH